MDEHSLKKQVASNISGPNKTDQRSMQMANGTNNRQNSLSNTVPGVNESMDNVNLSDTEGGQTSNATQGHQIRGKHFSKSPALSKIWIKSRKRYIYDLHEKLNKKYFV